MKIQDFAARLNDLIDEALEADLASDKICAELEVAVFRVSENDFN